MLLIEQVAVAIVAAAVVAAAAIAAAAVVAAAAIAAAAAAACSHTQTPSDECGSNANIRSSFASTRVGFRV